MRDKWEYLTVIRAEIAVRKLQNAVCYECVSEILDSLFIPEIAGEAREWMTNLVETDKGLSLNDQKIIWINRWADERAKVKANKETPDHYSLELNERELRTLFRRLQKGCLISRETAFDNFTYCLTGNGGSELRSPIVWTHTKRSLAYFVGEMFSDTNSSNLWKIAEKAFVYHNGDEIKRSALADDYSKLNSQYVDKSKNILKLDDIIKL